MPKNTFAEERFCTIGQKKIREFFFNHFQKIELDTWNIFEKHLQSYDTFVFDG